MAILRFFSNRYIRLKLREDSLLPIDIRPHAKTVLDSSARHVLLIGGSGVLAPFILRGLLDFSVSKITCLVRDHQESDEKARILDELDKYHLLDKKAPPRIDVVIGDIAQPQLGLSKQDYVELAKSVDIIIHNAAWTNHIRPYTWPHETGKTDMRETNTLSVIEALRLAVAHHTKPFCFVSTIAAVNRLNLSHELVEELPAEGNSGTGFSAGYPQSKFVAEKLIMQAMARGVPCKVFRPGQISGHSVTGQQFAENDHMMLEVKACVEMRQAPHWSTARSFVPVNILGEFIARTALDQHARFSVYNCNHPEPYAWDKMIQDLNAHGLPVKIVSESEWTAHLLSRNDTALQPFKSVYTVPGDFIKTMASLEYMFTGKVETHHFRAQLAKLNLQLPTGAVLWERYIQYFKETGFFK